MPKFQGRSFLVTFATKPKGYKNAYIFNKEAKVNAH